jgi:hypothetical protein
MAGSAFARAAFGGLAIGGRADAAGGFRVAVHRDVGDVDQDLRRPVAALLEGEKGGRRVDELGGVGVVRKVGCFSRLMTNSMFVATPRMRNSRKARSIRAMAFSGVWAWAVTLTRSES